MLLLNLGCGAVLPPSPWLNLDTRAVSANNAVQMNILNFPWPCSTGTVDGILASHLFEHFNSHCLQNVLSECYRVMRPNGVLRVSVPDASYFREMQPKDSRLNAMTLFGEGIKAEHLDTFMGYALFFHEHLQLFTEDSLWCSLVNREYPNKLGSFLPADVCRVHPKETSRPEHYCSSLLAQMDNRLKFSLIMEAFKPPHGAGVNPT